MSKSRVIVWRGIWSCMAAASVTAIVCCGAPTGDPKTPPNSPLPELDRKEPDQKKPPTLPTSGSDAG